MRPRTDCGPRVRKILRWAASAPARWRDTCRRGVALIIGNEGPRNTHVPVDSDSGLTGYDVSYVNATDLHTVDKPRLHKRRGLLSPGEMATLEDAIRLYLGL
jgi:mRNA interferase MazF